MEGDLMVLLKTILSLGVVVAFIFALAYLSKKYLRPERWASAGSFIKIQQSFAIDPKKKLMVVEVDGRRMLLGVAEQSISLISNLDADGKEKSQGDLREGIRHAPFHS